MNPFRRRKQLKALPLCTPSSQNNSNEPNPSTFIIWKSVTISFFVQIWPRKEKDDSGFAACEMHIGSPTAMCPSERVGSLKKIYPLHNISTKIVGLETKIVCVRDQGWRKRANLVPFSCVHNLVKIVHQLSCDFGYSYQWEADPLYQALAVWHWHSSFLHCGWCLDLVLTTEATMQNCQKLCQPLLKCPRPGSHLDHYV